MSIGDLIGVVITLALLFGFIFGLFYTLVYPLFRMFCCNVGDVYYKNLKDKNPFEKNKNIRKECRVLEIKNGYVQYEDIDVYYNEENKLEFKRGWVHSCRLYPFYCFVVLGLRKKKK